MIKVREVRIVKDVKGVMTADISPVAMFSIKDKSEQKKIIVSKRRRIGKH